MTAAASDISSRMRCGVSRSGERGRVLAHVTTNDSIGRMSWLTLEVPNWIEAQPGQFALLQAEPSRCFLGRALSVSAEERDGVSFLIDPVGEGTRELCALSPGDPVWLLGPLGIGFDLAEIESAGSQPDLPETSAGRSSRVLVVAGGVGVAPFPLLLSRLAERDTARAAISELIVLAGFRDASQARALAPLETAVGNYTKSGLSCRLVVAAEDGSLGPPEKATDLLKKELRPGDLVVVCGSSAMSAAVWQVCSAVADVHAWFSLEANMACGLGSCHGCTIALADGSFARVCCEGPVFPGEAVFFRSSAMLDGVEDRA